LYRAELVHSTATAGEQKPAPALPPGVLAPSSTHWWEASPTSPAPSLPSADLSFWQPENPCSTRFKHCDEGTGSHHSTTTPSTQLTSSQTLASTVLCSPQSTQSLSSCHDAQMHCTQPFCDGSMYSSHSTTTPSTQLTSSRTLASTVLCSPRPSQSQISCHDAQIHCTRPFDDDGLSSKLLARDVNCRPLGSQLGTSLRRQGASSSVLASALRPSTCS
jgi:hypothetical protein